MAGDYKVEDLFKLKDNPSGKYILMSDFDLSNLEEPWVPPGQADNKGVPFQGTFDGNGHVISGLKLNQEEHHTSGFLGALEDAEIRNLGLIEVEVVYPYSRTGPGATGTGSLAGSAINTSIENVYAAGLVKGRFEIGGIIGEAINVTTNQCFFTGKVISIQGQAAGGLIGYVTDSEINNSYSSGKLETDLRGGGLVGSLNSSIIADSYSESKVEVGDMAGGLAGQTADSSLRNSFATGPVQGASNVGGLVGRANGATTIELCYADGEVTGTNFNIGGLAGAIWDETVIRQSFAEGEVTGRSKAGGLAGMCTGTATIMESYAFNCSVAGLGDEDTESMVFGRITGSYDTNTRLTGNHALENMIFFPERRYDSSNNYREQDFSGLEKRPDGKDGANISSKKAKEHKAYLLEKILE